MLRRKLRNSGIIDLTDYKMPSFEGWQYESKNRAEDYFKKIPKKSRMGYSVYEEPLPSWMREKPKDWKRLWSIRKIK